MKTTINSQRATILIVDDEPQNLHLLGEVLREEHEILVATNGKEALKRACTEEPPDLILLDIMMPEMDGYEVCRRLKKDELSRDIPVIFLTAMSEDEDEQKGLQLGAVDYVTKPISPSILGARIRTQLRLKEANDLLKKQAEILELKVEERTQKLSQMNQALYRFVPSAIINALGQSDILDVKLGDHVFGKMTILFTDIRSYTSIAETMSPNQVFDFINSYHKRMSPLIREHQGFVQQFHGDGVLSIFPLTSEDGLKAAIAMQRKLTEYNLQRSQKKRETIRVGMGLHCGPLMIGIIGDDERWESGVPSDTVNIASRTEGLSKHYGVSIVMSETAFNELEDPDKYLYRFMDKVQVKGRAQPLSMYEIFDADPQELKQKKLATARLFTQGQEYYFARKFLQSIDCFKEIAIELPDDVLTRLYLQRASSALLKGVSDDWLGIITMDKK